MALAGQAEKCPGASTSPWAPVDLVAGQNRDKMPDRCGQQSMPRSKCPWEVEDNAVGAKTRKSVGPAPKETCPWGPAGPSDVDTIKRENAAQRSAHAAQRQRQGKMGAAGSGAPKASAVTKVDGDVVKATATLNLAEDQEIGWVLHTVDNPDPDDVERAELIERCLSKGLDHDQVVEVLEEYHAHKMVQQTRKHQQQELQQRRQQEPRPTLQDDCVATKRMVRAAKEKNNLAVGPSDEEIIGIIQDNAPRTDVSVHGADNAPITLVAKRAQAKEASNASVGCFDTDSSRNAYFQSQQQASAVKNKNRLGSGIF